MVPDTKKENIANTHNNASSEVWSGPIGGTKETKNYGKPVYPIIYHMLACISKNICTN